VARNGLAHDSPYLSVQGYALFNGRLVHRMVWEEHNGPIPRGHVIHHLNGDRADNRVENLSLMTRANHCSHHQPRLGYRAPLKRTCSTCGRDRNEREMASEPYRRKCNKCRAVDNRWRRNNRVPDIHL
jgi:hypothetical protein